MRPSKWQVLSAAIGALLWAAPMNATVKSAPEVQQPAAASAKAARSVWPPETLAGTIMTVDASRRLLIVKGPGDVPFDVRVTRGTRIESGKQLLALSSLGSDVNRPVTVRFTPERSGDIARLIQIQK